jgi:hypothetical protein
MGQGFMKIYPYSTVTLPDGVVIGGEWPNTIISWPGGKCRQATKPEYDLFQALEQYKEMLIKLKNETCVPNFPS